MRTGDGARTGSRSRRVLRGLATGVLALGVVGLLIWGLMFFRVFVLLPQQARTEAQTGLDAAVLDLPALAEADGEALDAAFGPVVGTERSVQCSVYPVDRGWFVADHVHRCELRDVEYRVAPGAREQVAERGAEALADVPAWSEARDPRGIERESCTVVAESTAAASDEIPVGSPTVRLSAVILTDPDAVPGCLRIGGGSRDLDGADTPDAAASMPLEAADGEQLFTVVRRIPVSHSTLGCLPLPVFCQPASTTVHVPAFP